MGSNELGVIFHDLRDKHIEIDSMLNILRMDLTQNKKLTEKELLKDMKEQIHLFNERFNDLLKQGGQNV